MSDLGDLDWVGQPTMIYDILCQLLALVEPCFLWALRDRNNNKHDGGINRRNIGVRRSLVNTNSPDFLAHHKAFALVMFWHLECGFVFVSIRLCRHCCMLWNV